MFTTIQQVMEGLDGMNEKTTQVIGNITDESLKQEIAPGFRSIGRILWHIVQTIPEMMEKTGLNISADVLQLPPPSNTKEILEAYRSVYDQLREKIKSEWSDETLLIEDDMYGEKWTRAMTINALFSHEIHHTGQVTVLMRQAGLKIPGIYGPAKEQWSQFGMEAPTI